MILQFCLVIQVYMWCTSACVYSLGPNGSLSGAVWTATPWHHSNGSKLYVDTVEPHLYIPSLFGAMLAAYPCLPNSLSCMWVQWNPTSLFQASSYPANQPSIWHKKPNDLDNYNLMEWPIKPTLLRRLLSLLESYNIVILVHSSLTEVYTVNYDVYTVGL